MFNKNLGDLNLHLTSSSPDFKEEEALAPSKDDHCTLLQLPFPLVFSKTTLRHLSPCYVTFSISSPPPALLLEKAQFFTTEKAFF